MDGASSLANEDESGDENVYYEGGSGSGGAADGDADSDDVTDNQYVLDIPSASTHTDP